MLRRAIAVLLLLPLFLAVPAHARAAMNAYGEGSPQHAPAILPADGGAPHF